MAAIRTLGLHQPSAVPYLVGESIISPHSSADKFIWKTFQFEDENGISIEEELFLTDYCVVWSRGGVVVRSFRFDVEKEKVTHALFTSLPGSDKASELKNCFEDIRDTRTAPRGPVSTTGDSKGLDGKQGKHVTIEEKLTINGIPGLSVGAGAEEPTVRALVVVLQSQIHIFSFAGDTHVVPLPFEVDSVWATPSGLLFQRKIPDEAASPIPSAPPNSFVSSHGGYGSNPSGSFTASARSSTRFSLTLSPSRPKKLNLKSDPEVSHPRTFSLLDPHSEMGLVAVASSGQEPESPKALEILGMSEEILYVSSKNEFPHPTDKSSNPLILVVTLNEITGLYTVWTAQLRDKDYTSRQQRKSLSNVHSKRRSSHFDMTTEATTPVGLGPNALRESFGASQGRSFSNTLNSQNTEARLEDVDDFASQLGHDFGDIGGSWKASRRVSSLLARSDLGGNHDRSTFSDMATGSQPNAQLPRKGESFSGSTRGSFSHRRKSSLPAGSTSVFSTSSFLDAPVDKFLDGLNKGGQFEGFENMGLGESVSRLPKEVILSKVGSAPSDFSSTHGMSAHEKDRKFEIFTLSSFYESRPHEPEWTPLSVCILNKYSKHLVVFHILTRKTNRSPMASKKARAKDGTGHAAHAVKLKSVRQGSNILDCRKLADGGIARMLVLSATLDGRGELTLQSPWSTLVKVELPSSLMMHDPYGISFASCSTHPREAGLRRVLDSSNMVVTGLDHPGSRGKIDIIDGQNERHRLQIQLEPRNPLVRRIIQICKYALRYSDKAGDGILVAWWEVLRWLRTRNLSESDLEWTALVVTLFSMAVYFIEPNHWKPIQKPKKRKGAFLRTNSGNYVDSENWDMMLEQEVGSSSVTPSWMMTPAWTWINDGKGSPGKSINPFSSIKGTVKKNEFITRCAALAREFNSSPQGEAASGGEGYLPTAIAKDQETRKTSLATLLVALHLLREDLKLSTIDADSSTRDAGLMLPVLAQIGKWLGWSSWTWEGNGYYGSESSNINAWTFDSGQISSLKVPPEPFPPSSILSFVENFLNRKRAYFMTLVDMVTTPDVKRGKKKILQEALTLTPRTIAISGFLSEIDLQTSIVEKTALLIRWGLTPSVIDTLPNGVSAFLHEIILRCRSSAPLQCGPSLLKLVGRNDLSLTLTNASLSPLMSRQQILQTHEASRDVYTIGTSVYDIIGISSFEASAEADRLSVTKLIFREDRRFFEAVRILSQMRPPVVECHQEPDWSEADLLEAQKELVQLVTMRTLSLPNGRALLSYSCRVPLSTEKLPIPSFSLQCVVKPSNITISVERMAFTEERVCWAFFHNGVSTGLAISKAAKGIDTSWILYNKPLELTNRHAGFLLALGLNGHLKSLAKWVAFKYLTPKHTMTSIGLLLGLSVSYLGTMDTLITRLLSVHITRMLPPGAAELNLSPLTQTTGIMGIGLLYCNSQHRRMSEIMLSEIENMEIEDASRAETLREEGYRLAAGFALGLINLAKGEDLKGLRDMRIIERLLTLAVGTKKIDMVHVLDKSTAAATIAIAIISMKSNDISVAMQIDIPDTHAQFDYVRPDLFLLRTLARHLIMWDSIRPNHDWVQRSLPESYKRKSRLITVNRLSTDDMPLFYIIAGLCFAVGLRYAGSASIVARDLVLSLLDQFTRLCQIPAVNYDSRLTRNSVRTCQNIVAVSASLIMAGTGDVLVFRRLRLLHGRVDADTTYGSHMAAHMAIGMLFLGGGTYTLGTSDIAVASLLCAFYPIFPTTVLDNKCHLQAFRHLWVLATEPRCLIPRDLDTGRPMQAPVSLTLRSGHTKKVQAPFLLPELSTIATLKIQSPDHWNQVLDFTADETMHEKFRSGNPSIYLKRRNTYNTAGKSVFAASMSAITDLQDVPVSSTRRKGSPNVQQAPSSMISNRAADVVSGRQVWDWVFNLPAFRHLDMSDRTLVLPPIAVEQPQGLEAFSIDVSTAIESIDIPNWIRPTVVEARLEMDRVVRGVVASLLENKETGADTLKDGLWQLRLLFAWAARSYGQRNDQNGQDEREEKAVWLRREILEEARWRIWAVQSRDMGLLKRDQMESAIPDDE